MPFVQNLSTLTVAEQGKPKDNIITQTEEDPTPLEQARANFRGAQDAMRINNLTNFLLDEPEEPEIDRQGIDANQKMAKKAALMQVLDSLAGGVGMATQGQDAYTESNRFDQLGLSAVKNLQNIDEQHRVDLNRYNQRKNQVEQYNKGLQMQVEQNNAQVDYEAASQALSEAISEERQAEIEADNLKSQHYEVARRYISQGQFDQAKAHLKAAGLTNEEISSISARTQPSGGSRANSGAGSSGMTGPYGQEIEPRKVALYNQYQTFASQVTDDMYQMGTDGQRDYSKPKRGTPAFHMQRIEDNLGADFYVINEYQKRQQEEQSRAEAPAGIGVLQNRYQPYRNNAEKEEALAQMQTTADRIRSGNASQEDADTWGQQFIRYAVSQGVDPEEAQQKMEEELVAMMPDNKTVLKGMAQDAANRIKNGRFTEQDEENWLLEFKDTLVKSGMNEEEAEQQALSEYQNIIEKVKGKGTLGVGKLNDIKNKIGSREKLTDEEVEALMSDEDFLVDLYSEIQKGGVVNRTLRDALSSFLMGYDSQGNRTTSFNVAEILQSPFIMARDGFTAFQKAVEKRNQKIRREAIRNLAGPGAE